VFLGKYRLRLDDKGRLFLPAKYREELAGGVVITKGHERALFVFPLAEFERMTEPLRNASVTVRAVRDYSRMLGGGGFDDVPDKQGRVNIPQELREYARLERECVVVGALNRLEIWNAASWDSWEATQDEAFSAASEEVLPKVL
jgi:MraZ protein